MSENKQNSVTIPHAILAMIITVLLSVGGAYGTIHVTKSRVDRNEKDIQDLKDENKARNDQYIQILEKLTYIQAKLDVEKENKDNGKDK